MKTPLPEAIRDAVATEHQFASGGDAARTVTRMAEAAERVANVKAACPGKLRRIIEQNLRTPDFTTMAEELAAELTSGLIVHMRRRFRLAVPGGRATAEIIGQGQQFMIVKLESGWYEGKWCWATDADESQPFNSIAEAQQDAIRYVRERDEAEREREEEEADREARGGRHRMSDEEFDWKTSRL